MIRLVVALVRSDPRASWAPGIVFAGAAFLSAAALNIVTSVTTPSVQAALAEIPGSSSTIAQIALFMMVLGVGVPTVFVVTGVAATAVAQERRTFATWRLAGASPLQVRLVLVGRMLLVAMVSSVLAVTLAPLATGPALTFLVSVTTFDIHIPATTDPESALVALAIVAGLAFLGALRPAQLAARIAPIEALRESREPIRVSRRGWVLTFALVAIAVPLIVLTAIAAGSASTFALLAAFALGAAITVPAAAVVPAVMRGWTALKPLAASPSWIVARATALSRLQTTTAGIAPLTLALIILGTYFSCVRTLEAATGATEQAAVNDQQGLILFAPGAVIGLLGATAVLIAIGRFRKREHAQLISIGTSPRMFVAAALIEPIMYVASALILAVPCISLIVLSFAVAVSAAGFSFAPRLDVGLLATCAGLAYSALLSVLVPPALVGQRRSGLVELARDA